MAALQPFGKAPAIGREVDPAMDDQLERGKKINEPSAPRGVPTRQLVEKQEEPARNPGDAADIGRRALSDQRDFFGPIGEARDLGWRERKMPRPGGQRGAGDTAQIATFDPGRAFSETCAATEQQAAPGEHAAVRPALQVVHENVEPGPPVRLHGFPGDRDEFGGAAAGPRA